MRKSSVYTKSTQFDMGGSVLISSHFGRDLDNTLYKLVQDTKISVPDLLPLDDGPFKGLKTG